MNTQKITAESLSEQNTDAVPGIRRGAVDESEGNIVVRKVLSFDECREFVNHFFDDPLFSDPMLSSAEQLQINLKTAIQKPETNVVLGVYRQTEIVGLFSFLTLRDEQYIEMIAGLSRDPGAYDMIFTCLEQHYPNYKADFVFNPNNRLLKSILTRKGAEFEIEQQKMILTRPAPQIDTDGVELLSEQYRQQYFVIHNQDMYWTGEKVAAAANKFRTVLAIKDGKVVGYIDVTCCFDENEVFDLLVLENYRRMGYGRKLLAKALEMNQPKGMMLLVDVDNDPAVRLYESMGFETAKNQNNLTAHWRVPTRSFQEKITR